MKKSTQLPMNSGQRHLGIVPKLILLTFILGIFLTSNAQVKLGDNPNTINPSAILELESNNKALILPRLTNLQMFGMPNTTSGMVVYNTDSAGLYYHNTSTWVPMRGLTAAQIITLIANNVNYSPLIDSVWQAVSSKAKNITTTSGAITLTGGQKSVFRDVTINIDNDSLFSIVIHNPVLHDSIIKIVADNSNKSPLRDSIFSTVVAQGKDVTGTAPIVVSGGAGASLKNVSVRLDSAALAIVISQSPVRDTIISILSSAGKDLTAGSGAITVTNGIGSTLKNVTVDVNKDSLFNIIITNPLIRDSIIKIVSDSSNHSPLRDSIFSTVTAQGRNVTGTAPIVVAGGAGASLQNVSLSLDSAALAVVVSESPVRDTVLSIVAANGKDLTAGSGAITVTNGLGSTLKNVTVDVNKDSLFNIIITNPLIRDSIIKIVSDSSNHSPLRDSIFSTVTAQGRNVTGTGAIVVTGGTGASLQNVSLSLDSAALAVVVSESPVRDTVLSIVAANGRDLTAGSGAITVTNGIGSTLKNVTVDVNKDSLFNIVITNPLVRDSIIKIVSDSSNHSPLRDSIFSTVVAQGRNLTSTTPVIAITNGTGTTLKNTSVTIDSLELVKLIIRTHIIDSINAGRGFNASGSTTSNSFLSLSVTLGSNADVASAYVPQQLTDTSTFPSFNSGVFSTGSPSTFTAPVTGLYSLTFTATLIINPSLASVGGTYTWGIAIMKTNGVPTTIQTSRTSQALSASLLGLGAATASSNTVTTLVKLNAGDKVGVGVGATDGVSVGLVSSLSVNMRFSGYLVR